MNRLVWNGTDPLDTAAKLPPAARAQDAPARILFVHTRELGFGTTAASLEHYAAKRDDVDAVHIVCPLTFWMKLLGKELPKWLHGLDYHNTRMTLAFGGKVERTIRRHFPLQRFDVVHIMTRENAWMVRGKRPASPKFVVNVDTTLESWDEAFEITRYGPRLDRALDSHILRSADAVAFASRWAMRSAVDNYHVQPERCILHMPCARQSAPPTTTANPRPRQDRPLPCMIFIGNAWERKGGPRLLRWHQQHWSGKAILHICSAEAPIDRTAKNVVWHGRVAHDKLIGELLPHMDLCVIPTFEDTFLIAAQEAQSAGVPVISTRIAAIPEVVLDGRTGFLFLRHDEAGYIDSVNRLLNDPPLRRQLGDAARIHVRVNLNADIWHNHLLDQLVALADGRSLQTAPASPPSPA